MATAGTHTPNIDFDPARQQAAQAWKKKSSRIASSAAEGGAEAIAAAVDRVNAAVQRIDEERLSRALGWFSVGLGAAQILAPRALGKAIGVGDHRWLMRACGARELISGVGILTQRKPAGWLWSRVGGDVVDLALLGRAMASPDAKRGRVAAAAAVVSSVTALDVLCSRRMDHSAQAVGGVLRVSQSIAIDRPVEELYRFWRNLENLPQFMHHVESIKVIDGTRSHWKVKGPAGTHVEWDAEIVNERPNELIAWQSVAGADVDHSGAVRFEPAHNRRSTVLHVDLRYDPPAGAGGAAIAKLFGKAPDQQIRQELRRFKQLLETGEIATVAGQPSGQRSAISRLATRGEQP